MKYQKQAHRDDLTSLLFVEQGIDIACQSWSIMSTTKLFVLLHRMCNANGRSGWVEMRSSLDEFLRTEVSTPQKAEDASKGLLPV